MTSAPRERRVPLAGAYNFRDLGGYPARDGRQTRWGRIYRSSALHRLTDEDIAHLERLGVRSVYDLRSPAEHERDRGRLLDRAGIRHFHNPIQLPERLAGALDIEDPARFPPGYRQSENYRLMLDHNQAVYRDIFQRLADPEMYPFVVHCAGGKDRAGVASALILAAVGVPEETIVADYALTTTYFADRRERSRQRLLERGHLPEVVDELLGSEPAWMASTLRYLEARYGGVEAYLRSAGVTAAELAALQEHFLE